MRHFDSPMAPRHLANEIDGKVVRERVPTERGNAMDYFDGIYKAIREGAPLPVTA